MANQTKRIKAMVNAVVEPFYDGDVIVARLEEEVYSKYWEL